MKIYMLKEKLTEKGCLFLSAEVTKETDKAYMVDNKKYPEFPVRVNKASIGQLVGLDNVKGEPFKMFGSNREKLLEDWNNSLNELVKDSKKKIEHYRGLFSCFVEEIEPVLNQIRDNHSQAPQKTEKKEDVKVIKKEKKSSPTSEEKGSSKNKKKIIHVKKHK